MKHTEDKLTGAALVLLCCGLVAALLYLLIAINDRSLAPLLTGLMVLLLSFVQYWLLGAFAELIKNTRSINELLQARFPEAAVPEQSQKPDGKIKRPASGRQARCKFREMVLQCRLWKTYCQNSRE